MTTHDSARGGDIHRLLDEAFAGVDMTPEVQDLKEEMRDNLLSRVAELEAGGASPHDAARRAMSELGDVRWLIGAPESTDDADEAVAPNGAIPAATRESAGAAALRHRVRPNPGFVVRTVLFSIVAAASVIVLVLGLVDVLALGDAALIALAVVAGLALGVVTADALHQETTVNYPLPTARSLGFGAGTGLIIAGLAFVPIVILRLDLAWLALAGIAVIGGIALLSYLGATKTNRHKAWVVQQQHEAVLVGNRFEDDPASAARFGIYTAAIWIAAIVLVPIVGFTAGWLWAPLPIVGALVAMLIVLARMLFAPGDKS